MASAGWRKKDAEIAEALRHARERRMCLAAQTKPGVRLLGRRVENGMLVEPFPHLYEEPSYWKELSVTERALRVIRGAALLHPEWVFCDVSAAIAHDLQVSYPSAGIVHVVTSSRTHARSTDHIVYHMIDNPDACTASGVHVVDLSTCVKGCMGSLDLPRGLAVADSYLRQQGDNAMDLSQLAASVGSHRARSRAKRTATYADARAENGGESVARGVMIELGYQIPELQVEIENPFDLAHPYRVDFLWPAREGRGPIVGELDGMGKYTDAAMLNGRTTIGVLSDERVRESRLTIAGASIMRFRFADVLDRLGFDRLLCMFGVPKAVGCPSVG